jgi:hypothetical protein
LVLVLVLDQRPVGSLVVYPAQVPAVCYQLAVQLVLVLDFGYLDPCLFTSLYIILLHNHYTPSKAKSHPIRVA